MREILYKLKIFGKRSDKVLLAFVLAACVFGVVIVSSATRYLGTNRLTIVQSAAVIIGFAGLVFLACIDYEDYKELWKIAFPAAIILMVYTAFFGVTVNGNRNWLNLGITMFQPSEIVKLIFIVTLAYFLDKYKYSLNSKKAILSIGGVFAVLAATLILQKDTGTLLVYGFILVVMLFCAGLHWLYFASAGVFALGATPIIWNFVLSSNQKDRILVMFNPYIDPLDKGYQVILARNALGSGGWFGEGLYKGVSTQYGNLPGRQTDFILACIGEELGFVGVVTALIILAVICFTILKIAIKTQDAFGKFICIGVFAMFTWQIFCNVGMNVSLMPVIGITLPFFSYGGSSMLSSLLAIGLVLSVRSRRDALDFTKY